MAGSGVSTYVAAKCPNCGNLTAIAKLIFKSKEPVNARIHTTCSLCKHKFSVLAEDLEEVPVHDKEKPS
jgi:hypothetical protein